MLTTYSRGTASLGVGNVAVAPVGVWQLKIVVEGGRSLFVLHWGLGGIPSISAQYALAQDLHSTQDGRGTGHVVCIDTHALTDTDIRVHENIVTLLHHLFQDCL